MADRAYDWDEPDIDNPEEGGTFTLLPPGDYPFTIAKFERGIHEPKPGGKLPPCKKAMFTIRIDGGELGEVTVKHTLFLYSTQQSFLSQFFASIGFRKHGEKLSMPWDKTIGAEGWCRVIQKPGKNPGVFFNEIKAFIDPPAASATEDDDLAF